MAKLLLFDGNFKTIECEELEDYHKHLQCNVFDVVTANIGDKRYDIFCDDEGLFKKDQKITAVCIRPDGRILPYLVGNLIFANHDEYGNTTDLSDEDVERIERSIGLLVINNILETVVEIKL